MFSPAPVHRQIAGVINRPRKPFQSQLHLLPVNVSHAQPLGVFCAMITMQSGTVSIPAKRTIHFLISNLTCRNVRDVPSYGTKQPTVTASGRYERGAGIFAELSGKDVTLRVILTKSQNLCHRHKKPTKSIVFLKKYCLKTSCKLA